MSLFKGIVLTGVSISIVLLAAACSGPVKPASDGTPPPNAQLTPDPNVQVIDLPAPAGAKPGQKIRAIVSPYPPGSQEAKDAAAAALKDSAQPKQP